MKIQIKKILATLIIVLVFIEFISIAFSDYIFTPFLIIDGNISLLYFIFSYAIITCIILLGCMLFINIMISTFSLKK